MWRRGGIRHFILTVVGSVVDQHRRHRFINGNAVAHSIATDLDLSCSTIANSGDGDDAVHGLPGCDQYS